ncbi:hypothetical protein L218DRAFT_1081594 [Marasmius fiardii PR-910]|nr:hypothetical protein L218DRAFT_1081594 [Marasmius fiardii PR-910]
MPPGPSFFANASNATFRKVSISNAHRDIVNDTANQHTTHNYYHTMNNYATNYVTNNYYGNVRVNGQDGDDVAQPSTVLAFLRRCIHRIFGLHARLRKRREENDGSQMQA